MKAMPTAVAPIVPDRSQPEWVRSAKSRVVLQGTGDWLMSMLPDDPESTILKRLKKPRLDEQEPQDTAPGSGRSGLDVRPDGPRHASGYGGRAGQQFVNAGMAQAR